jgi:hypothetical protein
MPNKIRNIALYELRNEAHFGFHSEFVKLVSEYELTEAFQALVDSYMGYYDELDSALKIIRRSIYTGQMAAANRQRHLTFRRCCTTVEGFLQHSDPEKRLAAERLNNIIRTYYRELFGGSYDEKTYAFHNMLQDIRATETAGLQALNLTGWVSELETNNQEFKKLKTLRYENRTEQPAYKVASARRMLDAGYQNVVEYLNSYITLNPSDENTMSLIAGLNTRIESYRWLLSRWRGKRTKGKAPVETASSSSSKSEFL